MKGMNEQLPCRASVSEEMRAIRDAVAFESLPGVTLGLGLLYTIFAIAHPIALSADIARPMAALAAVTAAIFFGLRAGLSRFEMPKHWAHPVGGLIAGLVLLNSLAHLYLERNPHQSTNLLLLIAGVGLLFYPPAGLC